MAAAALPGIGERLRNVAGDEGADDRIACRCH